MRSALPALFLLIALAACSGEQAYYGAQNYERNRCERLPDQDARARCLAANAASYDDYRRQAGAAGDR